MSAPLNNKYLPTSMPIPENQGKQPEKQASRDPLLEIFRLAWNPNLNPAVRARLYEAMKTPPKVPENALAASAKK